MNFFTTFAQRRILKHYWSDNQPFTLDDLIDTGTLHIRSYGKILLRFMERLSQVIPCGQVNGQTQYIGTTDSKLEWKYLRWEKTNIFRFVACCTWGTEGMNRYEIDEVIKKLEVMLEQFKRHNGLEDAESDKTA